MRSIVVSLSLVTLLGCSENNSASVESKAGFKADQVIALDSFSFGCEYESRLRQAVDHYARKEITAWADVVNSSPYCFGPHTFKKDPGINWVVLQIRGQAMQISTASVRDFEKLVTLEPKITTDQKYWTLVSFGHKTADSVSAYREDISNPVIPAAPTGVQSVPSKSGRYVILVAALERDVRFRELEEELKKSGIKYFSSQAELNGKYTMRLQVGPFPSKKVADAALVQLKDAGLGGILYPRK